MTPEPCPDLVEIERHVVGELAPERASRVDSHVSACDTCSRHVDELRADRELAQRLRRSIRASGAGGLPTIAGYRVLREIGRGGMGVVHEAEQISPSRRVALKVVRGSQYVDESTLRLFQREIRVLARLEHPGIATLHDAGVTAGEHYFAMEFVDGRPLTDHARELPLSERIACFRRLCEAIDFAHQRGVVHRDLKPSNVLVTADGRVKVLDFGLAKITDADVSLVTEPGHIRGTLAYMSPEQARGDPTAVGPRSDVYSLGVILFELVCGSLPIDTSDVLLHEAARRIVEDPPRRPSTVEPSSRGDLETIVLKALEKDPARRYEGPAGLSEDLRRFVAHEPILARPPSATYELRKFVARHRTATALTALVVVLAIGTAVWTSILYRREADLVTTTSELAEQRRTALEAERSAREEATRQKQVAEARLDRLRVEVESQEGLVNFLFGLFDDMRTPAGRSGKLTASEILQRAIRRLREGEADMSRAVADPRLRLALYSSIGPTAANLGLHDDASFLLEEALKLARELQPGKPIVARLVTDLALLRRAQGRTQESLALHEEAVTAFAAAEGAESLNTVKARVNLVQALREAGEPRRAADLAREILQAGEHDATARQKRRSVQAVLGLILYDLREYEEATEVLERALEEGSDGPYDLDLANVRNTLGMVQLARGDVAAARASFQAALDRRLELLEPESETIATSYNNLAAAARSAGDWTAVEEYFGKARAIYVKRAGPESLQVAQIDHNRAVSKLSAGAPRDALPLARRALEVRRNKLGRDQTRTAESAVLVAELLLGSDEATEAKPLLVDAISTFDAKLTRTHPSTIQARLRLAQAHVVLREWDDADRVLRATAEDARETKNLAPAVSRTLTETLEFVQKARGAKSSPTDATPVTNDAESMPK